MNPLYTILDVTINVKYISHVTPIYLQGISGEDYQSFNILLEKEKIWLLNYKPFDINDCTEGKHPLMTDEQFIIERANLIQYWKDYFEHVEQSKVVQIP